MISLRRIGSCLMLGAGIAMIDAYAAKMTAPVAILAVALFAGGSVALIQSIRARK